MELWQSIIISLLSGLLVGLLSILSSNSLFKRQVKKQKELEANRNLIPVLIDLFDYNPALMLDKLSKYKSILLIYGSQTVCKLCGEIFDLSYRNLQPEITSFRNSGNAKISSVILLENAKIILPNFILLLCQIKMDISSHFINPNDILSSYFYDINDGQLIEIKNKINSIITNYNLNKNFIMQ